MSSIGNDAVEVTVTPTATTTVTTTTTPQQQNDNDDPNNTTNVDKTKTTKHTITTKPTTTTTNTTMTDATIAERISSSSLTTTTTTTQHYPQVDFPYTFYNFINTISKSHPHIIQWSKCGNYFQINRHSKELPTLISKHFQHSQYQSLRRQMNMYGFHLSDDPNITQNLRHSNWWCRTSSGDSKEIYFCRDHPQLNKIRPRRRPDRDITPTPPTYTDTNERTQSNETKPEEQDVPVLKKSSTKSKSSSTTTTNSNSSSKHTGKRRVQVYTKPNQVNVVAELNKKYFGIEIPPSKTIKDHPSKSTPDTTTATTTTIVAIPTTTTSSDTTATQVHVRNCELNMVNNDNDNDDKDKLDPDGTSNNDDNKRLLSSLLGGIDNIHNMNPALSQTFPSLLHQFISDCATTNPDIVQWNVDHTAFNVEIHHPGLPNLLLKYFQHGNYSSLRRQLNFYGFRRDDEGFYRNENFAEGNYRNIVSRAARERKRVEPVKLKRKGNENKGAVLDHDDLSSVFDHDLSTYDTLKNDDMSFERMEDRVMDDRSLDPLNEGENDPNQVSQSEALRKFNVKDKVYVRDKDGVLYIAVIRRHLYGPQFHVQVNMGLIDSMEEAAEKIQVDDNVRIWHYFVHFDHWNVTFDRWASESDVFIISEETTAVAQRISQEHKALQQDMRKPRMKGKKGYQTVDGALFLREWKKRLQKIYEDSGLDLGIHKIMPEEHQLHADNSKSSSVVKEPSKRLLWTSKALSTERKYRQQGLTSRRIPNLTNGITIPFTLKKVVVQQWEYINQCHMMPSLPAPTTIRQALNKYLESKNIHCSSSNIPPEIVGSGSDPGVVQGDVVKAITVENSAVQVDGDNLIKSKDSKALQSRSSATKEVSRDMRNDVREQEWRDMADGIAMLFDEALESRLLYSEELPQLNTLCHIEEFRMIPYSELYGCEHLIRLFIRLPEMLADNLPEDEGRQIMAMVNDFVRYLHKNHSTLFTQTHRKLNEFEKVELAKIQKQEEKKRKERSAADDADISASKKVK